MTDHADKPEPIRVEGPTPNGDAYVIAYDRPERSNKGY
jgi:hypothetical protein